MERFFNILKIWIKSWFVCQHFAADLEVDSRYEKVADDGEFEEWICSCTCQSGEYHLAQTFSFSKDFLNKTGIFAEK